MNNKKDFVAWVRGKRNVVIQEGGYLIPQKVKRAKKGFIAWLWRLFKNERGFEWVNLQEEFIAKAHLTPLALDGAAAPDNQQVLPADVLVGEGTLPEPPRQ